MGLVSQVEVLGLGFYGVGGWKHYFWFICNSEADASVLLDEADASTSGA